MRVKRKVVGGTAAKTGIAAAVLAVSLLGPLVAPGAAKNAADASTHGWAPYGGRENGVRVVFELKGTS